MGQDYQVTIALKLRAKKDKTITRERGILPRLTKPLVTPQSDENDIKSEGRKRRYGRSHKKHTVKWRLIQV